MCLGLDGGCHLRGAPLIGSLGTLGSNNLRTFSDSLSFSAILSASLFILLIFFLLNPALVLLDALVILSSKASIWDFRLSISASRLMNFLASLESLFCLHFSCLLVRGASLGLSDFIFLFTFRFPSRHLWRSIWFPSRHLWGWRQRSLSSLGLMFIILKKSY